MAETARVRAISELGILRAVFFTVRRRTPPLFSVRWRNLQKYLPISKTAALASCGGA